MNTVKSSKKQSKTVEQLEKMALDLIHENVKLKSALDYLTKKILLESRQNKLQKSKQKNSKFFSVTIDYLQVDLLSVLRLSKMQSGGSGL